MPHPVWLCYIGFVILVGGGAVLGSTERVELVALCFMAAGILGTTARWLFFRFGHHNVHMSIPVKLLMGGCAILAIGFIVTVAWPTSLEVATAAFWLRRVSVAMLVVGVITVIGQRLGLFVEKRTLSRDDR